MRSPMSCLVFFVSLPKIILFKINRSEWGLSKTKKSKLSPVEFLVVPAPRGQFITNLAKQRLLAWDPYSHILVPPPGPRPHLLLLPPGSLEPTLVSPWCCLMVHTFASCSFFLVIRFPLLSSWCLLPASLDHNINSCCCLLVVNTRRLRLTRPVQPHHDQGNQGWEGPRLGALHHRPGRARPRFVPGEGRGPGMRHKGLCQREHNLNNAETLEE